MWQVWEGGPQQKQQHWAALGSTVWYAVAPWLLHGGSSSSNSNSRAAAAAACVQAVAAAARWGRTGPSGSPPIIAGKELKQAAVFARKSSQPNSGSHRGTHTLWLTHDTLTP